MIALRGDEASSSPIANGREWHARILPEATHYKSTKATTTIATVPSPESYNVTTAQTRSLRNMNCLRGHVGDTLNEGPPTMDGVSNKLTGLEHH